MQIDSKFNLSYQDAMKMRKKGIIENGFGFSSQKIDLESSRHFTEDKKS